MSMTQQREVSEKPTAPGWYECRHRSFDKRSVHWWNGTNLFLDRDAQGEGWNMLLQDEFTDFIGPLVPAREPGEREIAAEIVRRCGTTMSSYNVAENTIAAILADLDEITESAAPVAVGGEVERLAAFKKYVHERLSKFGVPTFEDGRECRIGARLDWLFKSINAWTDEEDQLSWLKEQIGLALSQLRRNLDCNAISILDTALKGVKVKNEPESPPPSNPDERSVENG